MIKLFRNIRKNLLNEGKTSKYFKYAIGEIILVVIGILIALQINNWNENRKQQEIIHSIYQNIKEDIVTDITEIDAFIDEFEKNRKPSFEKVIYGKLSKEEYMQHPEYLSVLQGFKDFAINHRGWDLLKDQSIKLKSDRKELHSKLNTLYNHHLVEINVANSEMMREFVYNMNVYKQFNWYSSFFMKKENTGVIDYLRKNLLAKNLIVTYYLVYQIYINELRDFKIQGMTILNQIEQHND